MSLTIKTDRKWKPFTYRHDVPARVLERDFDYQDAEDVLDGFFRYRGAWYHLDMFVRLEKDSPFADEWHGCHSDSYFSGVLLKVSRDGESYMVATYIA